MKISIITVAYNSGATLRDTMRSVLSQNYPDWEHVIIDGNSTDNTLEIIRELEPEYQGRLKWISEPDKGLYDAMNKGVALASGDVIGILNSDDFYSSPEVLTSVARTIREENVDAVFGDIHFVDDSDLGKCVRYYSSRFFSRWTMLMGYQPAHPSFYCRKECYERFGTFDTNFRVAADFEHMFRLIYIHRIRTHYLPIDFVTMRTGGASTNGIGSHRRIIVDHHKAFAKHRIRLGYGLDFMRYPLKVGEVIISRVLPFYSSAARKRLNNSYRTAES